VDTPIQSKSPALPSSPSAERGAPTISKFVRQSRASDPKGSLARNYLYETPVNGILEKMTFHLESVELEGTHHERTDRQRMEFHI